MSASIKIIGNSISDAPRNGKTYARINGNWEEISVAGTLAFLNLVDSPEDYKDCAGMVVTVNPLGNGLEFRTLNIEEINDTANLQHKSEKNSPDGYAGLDTSSKLLLSQIPDSLKYYKGGFATIEDLQTAYSVGNDGWFALIKSAKTIYYWDTDSLLWTSIAGNNSGSGDMEKTVYDPDGDGVVDNATKVNNHTVNSDVPANAKFTDTTYNVGDGGLTEINFTPAKSAKLSGIEAGAEVNKIIEVVAGDNIEVDASDPKKPIIKSVYSGNTILPENIVTAANQTLLLKANNIIQCAGGSYTLPEISEPSEFAITPDLSTAGTSRIDAPAGFVFKRNGLPDSTYIEITQNEVSRYNFITMSDNTIRGIM